MVYAYFLALAIYPEVEAKAHAEMDRVVGSNRLPSYEDRENLPYVDAICKEVGFNLVLLCALLILSVSDSCFAGSLSFPWLSLTALYAMKRLESMVFLKALWYVILLSVMGQNLF